MKQKKNINSGFSFGLTSGIITTLGLLIGLSGTENKIIIITGILTIAIADAFSDALGVHISKESEKKNNKRNMECNLNDTSNQIYNCVQFFNSNFII